MSTFKLPRIMLAAPSSGSGKTMLTCGLLKALANRKKQTIAYKCGPDYIDPMFHTRITGISCRNLDTFFSKKDEIAYLLAQSGKEKDIAVLEGVMGYFDGVAGVTTEASSYDLADQTDTPVVLIVNTKGMSLSVVPFIKGFLDYEEHKHIKGVILNRTSPMIYPRLKEVIEKAMNIKVLGYCPELKDTFAGSRYLGLQMPQEIEDLQNKVETIAIQLEKTVDMEALLEIAETAPEISYVEKKYEPLENRVRIAVAKDEAFCFYYQDNLDLLEKMGAELLYFSPIHDQCMPFNIDAILLGGGYPELFAEKISNNQSMKTDILEKLEGGMPYLAECGGFMYLLSSIQNAEGREYPMVGFFKGRAFPTGKLSRFGYISLEAEKENPFLFAGENIKAHEFHYYDTDNNGEAYKASKPQSLRSWHCIHADEQGIAGFPHLYYLSQEQFIKRFLERASKFRRKARL